MDLTSYCFAPNDAFEERNKAYGAFLLRRNYQRRLLSALAVGGVAFTLGIASPVIVKTLGVNQGDEIDLSRVVELKNIEEPPPLDKEAPPPPPPVEPPPPPKVETVRFVPPEVAADEEVPDEEIPPPQDSLKEVQASTITQEGDPNADPNEIIIEDPVNEEAEVVGTPPPPVEDEVFQIVEQQPEFPGGMSSLNQFVRDNLEYPEIARKAGVEGRVIVGFIVGRDGRIRDVQVMRGIGAGCDEEAIRVVRQMPNWIPGKQRGNAVSVRFALPITFKLK
jgi:protein TonB